MELRHAYIKLAILLTTVGMVGCQNTDFYEKTQLEQNANPPGAGQTFTTGGGTSGGSYYEDGGSDGGGNGGGNPEVEVVVDSYTQTETITGEKTVDILWVIDNSGSMADEQANVIANFSSFITGFIQEDLDFQMAITTTDVSTSALCGATRVGADYLNTSYMNSDPADFQSKFNAGIAAGVNGSGYERGLQAAECFKDKNASFFRSGSSKTVIIVVSDENDQSPKSVSDYVAAFQQLEPSNPGYVKIYNISDIYDVQNFSTSGSARYKEAATLTSASSWDIYSQFSSSLLGLSDDIIELTLGFPLAYTPDSSSIEVKINGVATNQWSYEAASNVVTLSAGNIGDTVSITYNKQ